MDAQSINSILHPAVQEETKKTGDTLGKDDFLKMLTAQLQYQNPMDPMKDDQFVSQMAQFSSLEQLQNINSTMLQNSQWDMLLSQTINNTMATSLIGKTVDAEVSSVNLQKGGSANITFSSSDFALDGMITIFGADGNVVRTIPLSQVKAGQNSTYWNGKDNEGNELSSGTYSYQIDLKDAQGKSVTVSGYCNGVVEGVKYVDGQAMLLVNGNYIPLSQVREVKADKT